MTATDHDDLPVVATLPGTGMAYRLADDGAWYALDFVPTAIPLTPGETEQLVPCVGLGVTTPASPDHWIRRVYDKTDRGLWHLEVGVPDSGVFACGEAFYGHVEHSRGHPTATFDGDEARTCRTCRESQ